MFQPVGKNKWLMTKEFPWSVGNKDSELDIVVPEGFEFNGASAPWFSWLIIRPEDPRVMRAAAIHDYLYGKDFTRIVADAIFYEVLREHDFPKYRAVIAFLAVRHTNRWK